MKQYTLDLVDTIDVDNTLGEGVIWNKSTGSVWWTDIPGSKIFEYSPGSKKLNSWDMPERVGCFAFIENDDRLIVAFASGFAFYHLETRNVQWISCPELSVPGNRFNDGRCDRHGRFWAGTMVETAQSGMPSGSLYCVDHNGECRSVLNDIRISNGLCWSPDSTRMYHSDSPTNTMFVYDFSPETGVASNRKVFAQIEDGSEPDGATVDSEGYIYSAQWGGSRIVRFTPDGSIDGIITVPVSQPTCVAFGGENLDLLFVTTARADLSEEQLSVQPHAGQVLVYKTPFTGLADSAYKLVK